MQPEDCQPFEDAVRSLNRQESQLLMALAEARELQGRRRHLMALGAPYIETAGLDAAESAGRRNLEVIGQQRDELLRKNCQRCANRMLCPRLMRMNSG